MAQPLKGQSIGNNPPPTSDGVADTDTTDTQVGGEGVARSSRGITMRDYGKPIECAGPGKYEDLPNLLDIPLPTSESQSLFETPLYRTSDSHPRIPSNWKMPKYYIRQQQVQRDDWDRKEYEVDEDDRVWLNTLESKGKTVKLKEDIFEQLLDRMEKEYYLLLEEEEMAQMERKTNPSEEKNTKKRKSIPLTPTALEERVKNRMIHDNDSFGCGIDVLVLVGAYWSKKRAAVRARHEETVRQLMQAGPATYRTPELFPLASLNAHKSLLLNYTPDCRPYYTVCDHLFLIPRLQEEYKTFHNLNISLSHRRLSRIQLDTADGLHTLTVVRQHMEMARLLLDRMLVREKLKRQLAKMEAQLFEKELLHRGIA